MSPLLAARRVLLMPKPYHPLDSRPVVYLDATNSPTTLAAGMASQFDIAQSRYLTHAGNALLRGAAAGWWRAGSGYWDATGGQETLLSTLSGDDGMLIEKTAADVLQLTGGSGAATAAAAHGTALSGTTWYSWYAQYDGVNLGIALNGGALATQALASFSPGTPAFNVGANLTPGNYMGGRQQCLCGGDGVLSAAQIAALGSGTPLSYAQTLAAGITPGFFFPLDEPSGARTDLVGALSVTDTNSVTTAAGTCLQAVSAKGDLSGGGRNAVQATQAAQSRWRTAYVNGQPAWVFDGANDYDTIPDSAALQFAADFYAVLVWRVANASKGATAQNTLLSKLNAGATAGFELQVYQGALNAYLGGTANSVSGSGAIANNTWYVTVLNRVGSAVTSYINGSVDGTATNSADCSNAGQGILIGARPGLGSLLFLGGGVACVLLGGRGLSRAEVSSASRWAGRRYGIATT